MAGQRHAAGWLPVPVVEPIDGGLVVVREQPAVPEARPGAPGLEKRHGVPGILVRCDLYIYPACGAVDGHE